MAAKTPPLPTTPMSGAHILVQCLLNHGVDVVFAYPGGASMPIHQALTHVGDRLRTILPRHEQGGAFAAQGYARTTGKPGVCMGTSGPGALNLVTAIADAKMDSIPLIALTGQVGTPVIGSDAFQETPIVEVCRGITKHHYLVTEIKDLARVMKEAFHIATTGRPGPVLIDLPKDVQQFETVAEGSKLPGAAFGVAGGAAVGAAATSAVVSSGAGAVRELRTSIDADARRTAEQVATKVSELKTAQRW